MSPTSANMLPATLINRIHHLTYLVSLAMYFSLREFSSVFHCNGYTSV